MAVTDNYAFDAINDSYGEDMFITGGSLMLSEYENNMDPQAQKGYEEAVTDAFLEAWDHDPYKKNMDFRHWLNIMDIDLLHERAMTWEDINSKSNGVQFLASLDDVEANILEDAGVLQKLAHLHTGRIRDLVDIALYNPNLIQGPMLPRSPGEVMGNPPQVNPVTVPEDVREGGGDQGPY